jgi:hypothetical protein
MFPKKRTYYDLFWFGLGPLETNDTGNKTSKKEPDSQNNFQRSHTHNLQLGFKDAMLRPFPRGSCDIVQSNLFSEIMCHSGNISNDNALSA